MFSVTLSSLAEEESRTTFSGDVRLRVENLDGAFHRARNGSDQLATTRTTLHVQHRAVLFGTLGALIAYAAFKPNLQPLAFLLAAVMVVPFLTLSLIEGPLNDRMQRVAHIDYGVMACWATALVTFLMDRRDGRALRTETV